MFDPLNHDERAAQREEHMMTDEEYEARNHMWAEAVSNIVISLFVWGSVFAFGAWVAMTFNPNGQ